MTLRKSFVSYLFIDGYGCPNLSANTRDYHGSPHVRIWNNYAHRGPIIVTTLILKFSSIFHVTQVR